MHLPSSWERCDCQKKNKFPILPLQWLAGQWQAASETEESHQHLLEALYCSPWETASSACAAKPRQCSQNRQISPLEVDKRWDAERLSHHQDNIVHPSRHKSKSLDWVWKCFIHLDNPAPYHLLQPGSVPKAVNILHCANPFHQLQCTKTVYLHSTRGARPVSS